MMIPPTFVANHHALRRLRRIINLRPRPIRMIAIPFMLMLAPRHHKRARN